MKKIVTLFCLVMVLLAGASVAYAKKPVKRSSHSSHSSNKKSNANPAAGSFMKITNQFGEVLYLKKNGKVTSKSSIYFGEYVENHGAYIVSYSDGEGMEGNEVILVYVYDVYCISSGDMIIGDNLVEDSAFYMYNYIHEHGLANTFSFDPVNRVLTMHTTKGTNHIHLKNPENYTVSVY